MKLRKRFAAFVLACVMVVGGAVSVFADGVAAPAAVEETVELASTTSPSGGNTPEYLVGSVDKNNSNVATTRKTGTCRLTKNKTYLKNTTVKVNKVFTSQKGVKYKITSLAAKAFYNNTKAKKVVLTTNIGAICKNAFKTKTGSISVVKFKATKTTLVKGSMNGVKKVYVPKARLSYYKKILKKAGFTGTIKAY